MAHREHIQPFDIAYNSKPNTPELELSQKIILPWADHLADTIGNRILDLGAGQGVESALLAERGFDVISQDASGEMLKASYFTGQKVLGVAEKLPYKEDSFHGILLKDTLVFMSPDSRREMLQEARRVLTPGGKMLVISESTWMRVWKQDRPNTLAYKDTYPTNDNWQALLTDARTAHDFSFIFAADPHEFTETARTEGFVAHIKSDHNFESPYYKEKRWHGGNGGFVVELTK